MTFPAPPDRATGCASDLELDELLAGDLGGRPGEARLRAHLDGCARCRGRLASFAAVEPPPAARIFPRFGEGRARAPRRSHWAFGAAIGSVAAAAAAVLLFVVRPGTEDTERTKGGAALTVIVKRAGGAIEAVSAAGALRAGDEMRFSLASGRPGYAVVLGLDAAPSVTIYAPAAAGAGAIRVDGAGAAMLPGSIVADGTAGAERIVAVVCAAETRPEALRARALAVLSTAGGQPERVSSLGSGCLESSVLMRKEPPAR